MNQNPISNQNQIESQDPHQQPVSQPATPPSPIQSSSTLKKIRFIGITLIVQAALSIGLRLYLSPDILSIITGVVQIIIGVGLLKHNQKAYMFFNFVAILAIISWVISILSQAFVLIAAVTAFETNPSFSVFAILALLIQIALIVFIIWASVVLRSKPAREIFNIEKV